MVKIFNLVILFLSAISLCATLTPAQFSIAGQVVDVIDGHTLTLDTSRVHYTVQLQFIDPPESTQPLFDTVKQHLASMIKDKSVSVKVRGMSGSIYVGKVTLSGVDVSMQMLRDGAAWYSVPESQSQEATERNQYLEMEKKARAEKRGVWGVENVRPAWELRVERAKDEKARRDAAQTAVIEKYSRLGIPLPVQPRIGMSRVEFELVCGVHSKDYISVTDTKDGRSVYVSLYETSERNRKMCFGSFIFDGDDMLAYIRRTN